MKAASNLALHERIESQEDKRILDLKPIWLESLSKRGFTFTRIHGIEPLKSKRIMVDGKLQHRCLCKIGRRGEDCGRPGKHATDKNPVRNSGFVDNYTPERGRKMTKVSWGVLTGKVLPCGCRFLAIDVDVHKGGQDALDESIARLGPLPHTFKVETGTGGYHLYFKYDASRHIQSKANHPKLGKGLDVKADRGFVVAPGCLHKCGKRYKVHAESSIDAEMAFLPDAWADELETQAKQSTGEQLTPEQIAAFNEQHRQGQSDSEGARAYVEAALAGEINNVLSAVEGNRNQTLNGAVFNVSRYIPSGLISEDEVYHHFSQAAMAIGLDASDAEGTIRSGISGGKAKPKLPPERSSRSSWGDDDYYLDGVLASCAGTDTAPLTDEEEEAEVEKQRLAADRAAAAAHAAGTTVRRRKMSAAQRTALDLRQLQGKPVVPRAADNSPPPIPIASTDLPWFRCSSCNPKHHKRPCVSCASKLNVTRPRPDDAPCTNGGRFLIKSKSKKKRHKLAGFCPKCGMWGCPKCGYDNEVDHLANLGVYGQWLLDDLDQPYITLQSHDIENPKTEEVPVQHGCYKLILNEENRRKYSNKLTKLHTFFVVDYIGNDNYTFFVFLPLGLNPARLNYTPIGRNGQKLAPLTPTVITFAEFKTEHRLHISNAGRYIKLRKTDWELCDKPAGARKRHVAVAYCKALRLPKRMISTDDNERIGSIVLDEEGVLDAACEFGCQASLGDTRAIDRSHKRGLTQCLMKFWRFEFSEDVSDARVDAFIARLTGKEKKKVEVADAGNASNVRDSAQQNTTTGSRCLIYPLIT